MDTRPAQCVVRQLGPADATAYRALRLAALRAFPHAFRTDYEEALRQPLSWAEKRLATPGDTMFGAFDGAQSDAPLMAHLVAHARALGFIRQIKLTVTDGNTNAQQLYEAFGFRPFGLEPDAFLHDGRYYAKEHRQLKLDSHTS
jgi:GNAT superfamily N-acetyltransferase